MKTKVFALAVALKVFAIAPMWAQEKSPNARGMGGSLAKRSKA